MDPVATAPGTDLMLPEVDYSDQSSRSDLQQPERLVGHQQLVETDFPRSYENEIEKHEAIEESQFAFVENGPETLPRVDHEVSNGHFSG